MHHPKGFPSKLARLRANAEMTQKDLAKASGISVPQIGRYETGLSSPRMTALVKLAKALGVSVESLQDHSDEPDSVSLILESTDGRETPMVLSKATMEKLQDLSEWTNLPLDDVISEALTRVLQMIDESPEMAADLKRRIQESKKRDGLI
jgi:transcriptional regulator with XRE-family HTH domain